MAELDQLTVRGWELLRLTTEAVQLDVVPALGGTVVSLRRRADDAELLFTTPWGLRHRGSVTLPGNAQASLMDSFPGGWFSLFPNGGDSAILHGAEWGVQGEARVTWLDWTFTGSALVLTGRLVRSPFELTKTFAVRDHEVTVAETVTNVGGERIETMWGSQLMLGGDLLGPDTVVEAGASTVHPDPLVSPGASYDDLMPWPRSYGSDSLVNLGRVVAPGSEETRLAYLTDFDSPSISISRPSRRLGLDLSWDLSTWPNAWYELEAGGSRGFPWFRRAYYLALTPGTSWPAHGLHDARRVSGTTMWVEPGAASTSQLTAAVRPAP